MKKNDQYHNQKKKHMTIVVRADGSAELVAHRGGHCRPVSPWTESCPKAYFGALANRADGQGLVIAVAGVGIPAATALPTAVCTGVWCECKKSRDKNNANKSSWAV